MTRPPDSGGGGGLQAEVTTSLVPFLLNCCEQARPIRSRLLARWGYDDVPLVSELAEVLLAPDPDQPYGVPVSFLELADENVGFADALLRSPKPVLRLLDQALLIAQQRMAQSHPQREAMCVKELVAARLHSLPYAGDQDSPLLQPDIGCIRSCHAGRLLVLQGTIVSCGPTKLLEMQRLYECTRCRHRFLVEASLELRGTLRLPGVCPSQRDKPCKGTTFQPVDGAQVHSDYQEVRLQEGVQCLAMGSLPRSVPVILQDDLVDTCRPGDSVEVTGMVLNMWQPLIPGVRCEVELMVRALHLALTNDSKAAVEVEPEMEQEFEQFWEAHRTCPLLGRNKILASLCPQVYGLATVKLATALLLIGGVPRDKIRGHLHMLIVGDPGTGKSQFLKYAAKLSSRSVMTSGKGTSSAGLTATAVKEAGQWGLEAGALVLADGGVCCIDEFDGIKESDRASILEAMEQQTLSIAKAGLVTTLSTATSVFGVMNPKKAYDPNQPLSVNTGLSTPLLSRFDLVLVLLDKDHPEWDSTVSGHILASHGMQGAAAPGSSPLSGGDEGHGWSMEVLRKYVSWVKAKFNPVISPEAEATLLRYYQCQRQSEHRSAERTTIRMLESLARVAQAHARLMARNEALQQDAVVALSLMDSSMNAASVFGQASTLHSEFDADPDAAGAELVRRVLRQLDNALTPLRDPY
eukprot:jgi/Tetstr1/448162/TSEL_035453.t1